MAKAVRGTGRGGDGWSDLHVKTKTKGGRGPPEESAFIEGRAERGFGDGRRESGKRQKPVVWQARKKRRPKKKKRLTER